MNLEINLQSATVESVKQKWREMSRAAYLKDSVKWHRHYAFLRRLVNP